MLSLVCLFGVCLDPNQPTLIVLEYMHLGSLESYLQRCYIQCHFAVMFIFYWHLALCLAAVMEAWAGRVSMIYLLFLDR